MSGERGQDGQFVDEARHFGSGDDEGAQFGLTNTHPPNGLVPVRRLRCGLDRCARAGQHLEDCAPGRVEAHALDRDVPPGYGGSRGTPEGGRRQVARHGGVHRCQFLATLDCDCEARHLDTRAKPNQGRLGVVAGRVGLRDARRAACGQAGKQDGTLHLGAGHFGLIVDGLERPAPDGHRQPPVARLDEGAHPGERRNDASHRPPLQGSVPRQGGLERLCGENPREQAGSWCPSCGRRAPPTGNSTPAVHVR